jgi:uncharacterized protein YndB with AHSA1/START domain
MSKPETNADHRMSDREDAMATEVNLQPMNVVSERLFAHQPEVLFAAFADPDRLKLWWGPEGFTNTIHDFEFRHGGNWHFTMRAPDGSTYENTCTFGDIITGKRIEFIHHLPMHVFTMTMTFEPEKAGTKLRWHMEFVPNETNAAVRPYVEAGNEQNFDRLESHLKTRGTNS